MTNKAKATLKKEETPLPTWNLLSAWTDPSSDSICLEIEKDGNILALRLMPGDGGGEEYSNLEEAITEARTNCKKLEAEAE